MSNGLEPLGFRSSVFWIPEGLDRWWLFSSVVCNEGAAEATPSPWVVVAVHRWHTWCLFMTVHIGDGRFYFQIRAPVSCQVLLWQDLLGFHNGCTEIAGGPIEFLWKRWIVGWSAWDVWHLWHVVAWWSLDWHSLSTQGLHWHTDEL